MKAGQETRELGRLIDAKAVRRIRDANPDFAARLADANGCGAQRITVQRAVRSLDHGQIFAIVQDATRRVPYELRDDVAGDLTIALFEGSVRPEDAGAKVRELVTRHNRLFARRDISMDAEIGEGGFTFGGLIAEASSFDIEGTGHRVLVPQWA